MRSMRRSSPAASSWQTACKTPRYDQEKRTAMALTKSGFTTFSTAVTALLLALAQSPASAQVMDDLNGLWTITLDGKAVKGEVLTESYNGIRIRMLPDGKPIDLVRTGDVL